MQPLLSARFEYQIKKAATTSGITMYPEISKGVRSIVELAMPSVWVTVDNYLPIVPS